MFKDSKLKKALILSTLGAKGSHFYLRKNIGKIPYMLAFCTQQLAQFMDPDRFFCLDPEPQKNVCGSATLILIEEYEENIGFDFAE